LSTGRVAEGVVMTIEADLGRLAAVRAFVRDRLAASGIDREPVADVVQAVDECVTNVIVHGYDHRAGEVEIELEAADGDVIVRVRDTAGPFDPTRVPSPDPDRSIKERLRGGMGIPLMRSSVDELHHRLLPDGRNELTMIKRIDPAERGGEGWTRPSSE
jgi:anti-sigma regulatory factor (Ser/Thr protein kinase)